MMANTNIGHKYRLEIVSWRGFGECLGHRIPPEWPKSKAAGRRRVAELRQMGYMPTLFGVTPTGGLVQF